MKRSVLVLIGAVAGGLVGYFGFLWIARQGFYALVMPGGLLGVGASLFANRSTALCIVCGLLALVLGVLAEWQFAPFIRDGSLGYFVMVVHLLACATGRAVVLHRPAAFVGVDGLVLDFNDDDMIDLAQAEMEQVIHFEPEIYAPARFGAEEANTRKNGEREEVGQKTGDVPLEAARGIGSTVREPAENLPEDEGGGETALRGGGRRGGAEKG